MQIFIGIFLCLLHVLTRSDAVFNFTNFKNSTVFVEEQTAQLNWSVNIGSTYPLIGVKIRRGAGEIIRKSQSGITKTLPGREDDIDLVVHGTFNVIKVTFILRKLVRSDEMEYQVTVENQDTREGSITTTLKVLALPKLQFQPNQVGFCVNTIVNITCNVTFNNASPSNFTFFRNGTEVESKPGTLISGTTFQAISMFKDLNQVGQFVYSCNATNQDEGHSGIAYVKSIQVKDPPHIISCKDNIVEEGSSLFWPCSVNGSEPLTTSWHRGNNMELLKSGQHLTIANVSRADGGLYIFKASNGEGCAAASKTVQLDVQSLDLRACRDVSYALVTNSCLVSIPADGFPKPNLTCDVHNATKHNYTICSGGNVDTIGTNCYISNSIRSCNFTIPVFARVPNNIKKKYTMTIANLEFKTEYTKKDSADFKTLKESLKDFLYKVYKYVKYVSAIDVIEFLPGSVHVNFELTIIANVSDPLVPLKKELNRTKGSLGGQFSIDSLRSGLYVPPVTTTAEPLLSTGAIVGIAIGCAVLVIFIIVLLVYCCYCKRRNKQVDKVSTTSSRIHSWDVGSD